MPLSESSPRMVLVMAAVRDGTGVSQPMSLEKASCNCDVKKIVNDCQETNPFLEWTAQEVVPVHDERMGAMIVQIFGDFSLGMN